MLRSLLVVAAMCAACGIKFPIGPGTGGGGGAAGGGAGGGDGASTPPSIDTSLFTAVGVNRLLAEVGNARLELDPTHKDALTALGECADLISYCYAPGARGVSECFERSRVCTTQTPWAEQACCPADCKTAFDAEVAGGLTHTAALEKVLFREPDCFPGVRALLEAQ